MKYQKKERAGAGRGAHWLAWTLLAATGLLTVGCDSVPTRFVTGLSAEERALAAELPLYPEMLAEGSYQSLGQIEGISCQVTHDDGYRVSEENAREETQRAAFQRGATAVMGVSCQRQDRGQGSRSCFRSVVCQGVAVRELADGSR